MKKYRLTEETKVINGHTLHRIEALKDFGSVKKGELGGWIEKEDNLSQNGKCWICDEAKVYGNAKVFDDAWIYGEAEVYDNAKVHGYAHVFGNARVYDTADVYGDNEVLGNAQVYGNAKVYGCDVWIYDNAKVHGEAKLYNGSFMNGDIQ